jgi:hypothetical protein
MSKAKAMSAALVNDIAMAKRILCNLLGYLSRNHLAML